eukprot:gene1182-60122_t
MLHHLAPPAHPDHMGILIGVADDTHVPLLSVVRRMAPAGGRPDYLALCIALADGPPCPPTPPPSSAVPALSSVCRASDRRGAGTTSE